MTAVVAAELRACRADRDAVELRLRDAEGRLGRGEASPLPGYSPDTLATAAAELAAVPVAGWTDATPARLTSPAARFAAETAFLDLAAQRADVSLAMLLGGERAVPLSALVDTVAAGRAALARGVRTLKVKLARPGGLPLARALRAELGDAFALRLDANGTAVDLSALVPLRVELLEEPADLLALRASPVPLAADESLQQHALAALPPSVRAVVLKPMTLGGLHRCRALAMEAHARGLGVIVTHTFDGPIAVAAAAALALSLPFAPLACGLDRHRGIVPHIGDSAVLPVARPGLGLP